MKLIFWSIAGLFILGCVAQSQAAQRKPPAKRSAPPAYRPAAAKQVNQFVTVDEFIRAHRPAGTGVSIEGYAALGFRAGDGSVRLYVLDSVDHILTASDATSAAAGAAVCTVPVAVIRANPAWGWTPKGSMKFPMFTGNGVAQRQLRDVAPKIRLTGWATGARGVINAVTKIEITNENGEYVIHR